MANKLRDFWKLLEADEKQDFCNYLRLDKTYMSNICNGNSDRCVSYGTATLMLHHAKKFPNGDALVLEDLPLKAKK